ncbi:MAG: exo-alpha-sialidase [Dehalococcoidia bacterium]|nr:exo-alpha-sialidase [Dehalococcoidia bacterium]
MTVTPTIHWSKPICKEPDDYLGWGTIARKADGELLAVFSGRRESHWCPYGVNEIIRSSDDGETWSDPEIINNTPLDDRDTGLLVTRSGIVIMSWFTGAGWQDLERYRGRTDDQTISAWERHYKKIGQETIDRWDGSWTRRSTDGGSTWEPAVPSIASSPHGPTELHDGSLLYVGTGKPGNGELVSVRSTDDGQSWQTIGSIPVPDEHKEQMPYAEPHAIETDDGRIVSLWRHVPTNRHDAAFMQQSESDDGGRTWTVAHPTPMWGYPPHLIKLHDGSLLATYGIRRSPFGQRACLSYDGGRTWDIDNEIILRDDAPNGDLGYPSTVELAPGELLSIYYQIDVIGEKTCFIATRWSLS